MTENPLSLPKEPKNRLVLLKWLIFEPVLIKKFFETALKGRPSGGSSGHIYGSSLFP